MLSGKKIILGVTGGIAAYKCAALTRLLIKEGAEVKVIMTKAATDFVSPKTLSVLSKNKVYTDFFDANLCWNNHVELSEWADIMVFAPLTANTLAKMVSGLCDNLLLATYFSARGTILVAPAMDLEMYRHTTVVSNLNHLSNSGIQIIPAESGELASGLNGEGRMAEPENIVKAIVEATVNRLPMHGKTALVNAGPTYEPIDEVRFIGNRSSGKMGVAIAEELANQGAKVTLVLGPSQIKVNHPSIQVIDVETAQEMYDVMLNHYTAKDVVVCSAAVSDYAPETKVAGKIKKQDKLLQLNLHQTKDVLLELGRRKQKQILVGFALETQNLIENARAKLIGKNCDVVVANLTSPENSAFNSVDNQVYFLSNDNNIVELGLMSKHKIAKELVQYLLKQF